MLTIRGVTVVYLYVRTFFMYVYIQYMIYVYEINLLSKLFSVYKRMYVYTCVTDHNIQLMYVSYN